MSANRAVVVDPGAPGRLALREVPVPAPAPSEALIRVAAISLNRGELRRAAAAQAGWRPGWDLAGTVEQAATDGSGPAQGARVVGLLPAGAWAEVVAVPTHALGELPKTVTFAQAATLPVAGLTALHAVGKGGSLVGRNVLVTGASGGVGHFAIQLARLAGARVVGLVHQERHAAAARDIGAHEVVVGETADGAAASGPYHLIVESVGGDTLASALTLLALEGICVCFGQSGSGTATIDVGRFYATGGVRLYGLFLFTELRHEPASVGLARLLRLIEEGRLKAPVDHEAPWEQIGQVSQDLVERRFPGKAVLRIQ